MITENLTRLTAHFVATHVFVLDNVDYTCHNKMDIEVDD